MLERPVAERSARILAIAGTRPEAIKLAPLALEALWRPGLDFTLVGTGQHAAMFTAALQPFGIEPDAMLGLGEPGQSIDALAHAIWAAMPGLIQAYNPDLVVVQGDTTTAWAAALAAHDNGVDVAHVEAGLRSGNPLLPWPEERNRTEIDKVAELLFAPTAAAADNLRREHVSGSIHVTGNSGIDALLLLCDKAPIQLRDGGARRMLVTCHRRENQGNALVGLADALRRLGARPDLSIAVLLHPNPASGDALRALLEGAAGVELLLPVAYPEMIAAVAAADLVLSDSGGLQEECPALGVPLLVLRTTTERPEAIACGNAKLIGIDRDRIVAEVSRLLDDADARAAMSRPAFPFGDGGAAGRMLTLIERFCRAQGDITALFG